MHKAHHLNQLLQIVLILVISSCANVKRSSPSYPNPTPVGTEVLNTIYSPIPDLSTTAPELLFTPTPDSEAFSIATEIKQEYSQEEITRILFSKWLDHYLSSDVSLEMRLSEYRIDKINIPNDQHCSSKLGALFIAEAEVTAQTAMLSQAPIGQYSSRWMVSAGGLVSESRTSRTILFKSAISKLRNEYTLTVIMQAPLCD
jgi:hypothetical protein